MEAVKEDYRKANKIYKTNCDDYGYQLSCHSYATFAFLGRGQDKPNFDDVSFQILKIKILFTDKIFVFRPLNIFQKHATQIIQ